ncbi:hypothetical protein [Alistipes finegoldii]|jgi:hypothetical protein
MEPRNNNAIQPPALDELNIYEGGTLNSISINDLLGNAVAITQLVNDYNLKIKEVANTRQEITELKSHIEFLKVSPFISFLATVINIIGSVTIAIGVNNISNKLGVTLIILGAILVLAGSLSTVFYPYARGWFNKNNAPV